MVLVPESKIHVEVPDKRECKKYSTDGLYPDSPAVDLGLALWNLLVISVLVVVHQSKTDGISPIGQVRPLKPFSPTTLKKNQNSRFSSIFQ
jgi:hypothetical protein